MIREETEFMQQQQPFKNQTKKKIKGTFPSKLDVRSVFIKRPNFLSSAPTSKEIALRLLCAPGVRF
jgi:hypothetical protein